MDHLPTPATPAPARPSSTVLLLRDGAQGMEVFMVVRHHEIDFASGALVFPGGKLAAGDSEPEAIARCSGLQGVAPSEAALRISAVREAFEECGVLLARERGAAALLGRERLKQLQHYRGPLDRGEIGIAQMLREENLELACEELVPFAHWITPVIMPKRFDTLFFLARPPAELIVAASHDGREAVDSVWIRPADAITQAEAGTLTIIKPTLMNVMRLGFTDTVDATITAARAQPIVTVLPELVKTPAGMRLRIPIEAGYRVAEFEPGAPPVTR
jgi:8-oxo-dGTP pyrophosphatase MutT (NUDIX family)